MDTAPLRSVVTCFWYPGTKVQVLRAAGGHTTVFEQTLPAQHELAPPLELQRYLKPKLNLSLNHPPKRLPAKRYQLKTNRLHLWNFNGALSLT